MFPDPRPRSGQRHRLVLLAAIMTTACVAVAVTMYVMIHQAFMDGQTERLGESVRAYARVIEAIARHEQEDTPAGQDWRQHTLDQVIDAGAGFADFGEGGEMVLGAREGENIVLFLRHRDGRGDPPGMKVPWDQGKMLPLRRAIEGISDVYVGTDHRDREVLVASEPVRVLGMGLVAMIDLDVLNRPFRQAAAAAVGVGGLVVLGGVLLFLGIGAPLVRRLEASESRYRELFEHMKAGVLVFRAVDDGADFRVVAANPAVERLDGRSPAQLIGGLLSEQFPYAMTGGLADAFRQVWRGGEPMLMPQSFYEDDRLSGWRERTIFRLPSGDIVDIFEDVTARRAAEEGLQLASAVFTNTAEGIVVTTPKGIIERVNPAFTAITGYSAEEAVGKTPAILRSDRQSPDFYRDLWQTLTREGAWQGEIWNRRKNGEAYLEWLAINAIRDDDGTVGHYVAVFDDISEMYAKDQHIRHQAYHDALTGLANRSLFTDRLLHALAQAERGGHKLAVLFIDIDRFKIVNDSLGHDVGDQLLQVVALRIREGLRRTDTVARLGGDEFVILATEWDQPSEIAQLAEKVLGLIDQPFQLAGHDIRVGASIGIALYPSDGGDARALMKNADTAMYAVKESGRGRYRYFDSSMNDMAMERLTLESALRRALDHGELEVHYQPKYHLATGRMAGMEALVRWRAPTGELISPARFIPLAEETGLVVPLGEAVLRDCCRQIKAWRAAGLRPGPVAVNVSARQLSERGFCRTVRDLVEAEGLEPAAIDLEVTESAFIRDPERAATLLEKLSELGFKIVLDDFGTGYSSLGYLKRLPISVLKMDRSFISDVTEDFSAAALARGIIRLAQALDIEVVAEGVETEDQAAFLRANSCDLVQGYLFARPMPADQLADKLRDMVAV